MIRRDTSHGRDNSHARGVLRVMLDSNIFDRLDYDGEAASELENRGDLRLLVSDIQRAQLEAIPDAGRRSRYLALLSRLCVSVSASPLRSSALPADRHEPDRLIAAAAAARCDMLVTDDAGLLAYASKTGLRAMDWTMFVRLIIFDRR